MIVALRHMVEQLATGEIVKRCPGDEVVTFPSWPYQNKCAALAQRMVAKVDDPATADANALLAQRPDPRVRAQVDAEHGWHRRAGVHGQSPARAPVAKAAAPADADAALAATLGIESHPCGACEFVASSPAGLKIHRARVHKPA